MPDLCLELVPTCHARPAPGRPFGRRFRSLCAPQGHVWRPANERAGGLHPDCAHARLQQAHPRIGMKGSRDRRISCQRIGFWALPHPSARPRGEAGGERGCVDCCRMCVWRRRGRDAGNLIKIPEISREIRLSELESISRIRSKKKRIVDPGQVRVRVG